jgi:hypothetical protein
VPWADTGLSTSNPTVWTRPSNRMHWPRRRGCFVAEVGIYPPCQPLVRIVAATECYCSFLCILSLPTTSHPTVNKSLAESSYALFFLGSLVFSFGSTGVWTQGFTFAKRVVYPVSHTPVHFVLFILEMGSHELFALAGLELQSSPFQPPK